MTTRREFIQAGLVAGALPAALAGGSAALASSPSPPRYHKLLVDSRFAASVAFGRHAAPLAEEVHVFDGDITALWRDELSSQWRRAPRPLVGMTGSNVRFIFEQLGRDHDARVVFSVEHRPYAGGVQHRLSGQDSFLARANLADRAEWVPEMARLVATSPHDHGSPVTAVAVSPGAELWLGHDEPMLVTWVIAPIRRA